jgi:hypothetical protein
MGSGSLVSLDSCGMPSSVLRSANRSRGILARDQWFVKEVRSRLQKREGGACVRLKMQVPAADGGS